MFSYFTPVFVTAFLPVCVILYGIAPRRLRGALLLLFSYAFVFIISKKLIVFLLLTTASVYGLGVGMGALLKRRDALLAEAKSGKKQIKSACKRNMRWLLVVGILLNLGFLVALKYLGFFSEVASSLLALFGVDHTFTVLSIGITIGISFYTLMAISYLVDVYRETVEADRNIGRVALFLSFFPQIMEGPICRYGQTASALWAGEPLRRDNVYGGMLRIAVGFAKKFIIADRLDLFVKPVFEDYAAYDGGIIALVAILYTIQLYCDFSGCMDVGIGTARIFNVKLPENFKQPFFSKTASEFWMRWHITLGSFLKDYVYYPVTLSKPVKSLTKRARKRFGNRYGPLLVSPIALFCVWLGNGLWHGAGSQYVFFGMYYLVLIVAGGFIEPAAQSFAAKHGIDRASGPYKAFRIVRTLIVIFIGELFFRAEGFAAGLAMFKQIVTGFTFASFTDGAVLGVGMGAADFAVAAVFFAIVIACDVARERGRDVRERIESHGALLRWAVWIAIVMCVVIFGGYGDGYVPVDPMYAKF